MRDMTFQYGGKHFMPVRKFEQKDGDFYQITRRLRLDVELGIFSANVNHFFTLLGKMFFTP